MKNYSKQREEVLEALDVRGYHPTADELYEKIRKVDTTISKGTVYRNLNDLVNEGIILKISMRDGIMRYDYIRENHNHVVCTKCGAIIDFCYKFDSKNVLKAIDEQTGMKSIESTVTFYGVCSKCQPQN